MDVGVNQVETILSESEKFKHIFDKITDSETKQEGKMTTESGKYKQLFDKLDESGLENDKENVTGHSNIFPVENIKKGVTEFSKAISGAAGAFNHEAYKSGDASPSKDTAVGPEDPTAWETACEIASFSWDVTKDAVVSAEESIEKTVGPAVHNLSDTIVADAQYLSEAAKHAAIVTKDVLVNAEQTVERTVGPAAQHTWDVIVEDVRYLFEATRDVASALVDTISGDDEGQSQGAEFADFSDMAGLGIEIPVGMCTGKVMRFETPKGGTYEAPVVPKDDLAKDPLNELDVSAPISQAHGGNVDDANLTGQSKQSPDSKKLRSPEPHVDMCTPTSSSSSASEGATKKSAKKEDKEEAKEQEEEEWETAENYHHHHNKK
jgi:hypothetical protein